MERSPTRYALSGGHHIAYQVVGDGPIDLMYVPTWISHFEHFWEEPSVARFFGRLASFSRLILFDRRGTGLSERSIPPPLEEQMDDVIAVLDAVGSTQAALFAQLEGGSMAALFAASFPERVRALALYSAFARTTWAPDMPWARTHEERNADMDTLLEEWGTGRRLKAFAPSVAQNTDFVEWFARLERLSTDPAGARALIDQMGQLDVRAVLPSIRVPTLVMHRPDNPTIDSRHAAYLVEHIPGAKLVDLPGTDSLPIVGETEAVLSEVEEFLTGARGGVEPDRVLATILFTDIVGSTEIAARLGDRRWREVLGQHDDLVRGEIKRFRGQEIKQTGDGFLATFDGPARAVRCARAIAGSVSRLGIEIRAGLHTGEIEVRGDDIGGVAVHIGARVGAVGGPGEVVASSTVRDLVVGSGIDFTDRGEHDLKGVPGPWRLYEVTAA